MVMWLKNECFCIYFHVSTKTTHFSTHSIDFKRLTEGFSNRLVIIIISLARLHDRDIKNFVYILLLALRARFCKSCRLCFLRRMWTKS